MKVNQNQNETRYNFQLLSSDTIPKISSVCNHKIDLLLRRQNCNLSSIQCQQKCSHKHLKSSQAEQHQYCTENELRKFMINKIEHKNKGIMMYKEFFKEEIMKQIKNGEEIIKSMKDNLMKQIDMLYYGAVKSGNNELTAKGMDKFFKSDLEALTCHQVFCLFSFKPLIEERICLKISQNLQLVKQNIIKLVKTLDEARLSINQQMLMSQGSSYTQIPTPQAETKPQQKKNDNQLSPEKKSINKMHEETQQFGKIRIKINSPQKPKEPQKTFEKPTSKTQIQPSKKEVIVQKNLPKPVEKQIRKQDIPSKIIEKPKGLQSRKQEKKVDHSMVSEEEKQKLQKSIQKESEKTIDKYVDKPLTQEDCAKHIESIKIDRKTNSDLLFLEKFKMFEEKTQQFTKQSNLKSNVNHNEPKKIITEKVFSKPTENPPENQQFSALYYSFKVLGSLDKIFSSEDSKKEQTKIPQKTTQKTNIQKNPILTQPIPKTEKLILPKYQTKIVNEEQALPKKTIFSDLKRASESIKQKYSCEGRKIVKKENEFPNPPQQTDPTTTKTKQYSETKMIPQSKSQPQFNKNPPAVKNVQESFGLNVQTKIPTLIQKIQTKQIQKDDSKQQPLEKMINESEQSKPQPVLSGSDKILLELVRQSSQSDIQQHNSAKKEIEFKDNNIANIQQISTPTFKADNFVKNVENWHLDPTPKQTTKQSLTPEKSLSENQKEPLNQNSGGEKKFDPKETNQSPRSFLPKPRQLTTKSWADQLSSPQKSQNPIQTFEQGVKKMRLQHPGSKPFGRVSQNPIFNRVELFQRAQHNLKQLQQRRQQKRQEYNKNSLSGEIEKPNNNISYGLQGFKQIPNSMKESSTPGENMSYAPGSNVQNSSLTLEDNKGSQKKLNFNGQFYDSMRPSWLGQNNNQF